MADKIEFHHNSSIDIEKWDRAIESAVNSREYAMSWYLDAVDPDWHGIVFGNYNYVMPIILKKKWGVTYAYQPTFAQQHGIFPPATPVISKSIFLFLTSKLPYFDIGANAYNQVELPTLAVTGNKNYILSLNGDYETIQKKYNGHTLRYSRKAGKSLHITNNISLSDFLKLNASHNRLKQSPQTVARLKLIVSQAIQKNHGAVYGAYSPQNELCAAAFFLFETKRYTYLNPVSSDIGFKYRAMFAVIDQFIHDHSNEAKLLDFEGSNNEGIARFFKGYGAQEETYPFIHYNNLPWPLKYFKR